MKDNYTNPWQNNLLVNITATKKIIFLLAWFCLVFITGGFSQDQKVADSLKHIYQLDTLKDTAKLELLLNLSFNENNNQNLGLKYADELISLSQQVGNQKYLRAGYYLRGSKERLLGNLGEALDAFFKSAKLAEQLHNFTSAGDSYGAIADIYSVAGNHENAKQYYTKAIAVLRQSNDSISLASALLNTADEFLKIKQYDSALLYSKESKLIFDKVNYLSGKGYSLGEIGMVYASMGNSNLAEKNINDAIQILEGTRDYYPVCDYLISMSNIYRNKSDLQTAENYALKSLQLAQQYQLIEQIRNANLTLSNLYEKTGDINHAFTYYKNYIIYRDSLSNITSVQKMADLRTAYEVSQKQAEVDLLNQQKRNQRNIVISLAVILCLAIIIIFISLKHNKNKQKAYNILSEQKLETEKQKVKAEKALNELQITQKQLIQSEKMASLGQLTAGIAHEIQNPLNFVNNFSEVSVELLDELAEKISHKLADPEKAEANQIINDLGNNLKTISNHGKRAETIVKSMLQHSHAATGKRELTDINALSNQYLQLSYHGLKAKDNAFSISLETNFDNRIDKVVIMPQDVGRALLNIYNNAFILFTKKQKLISKTLRQKSY